MKSHGLVLMLALAALAQPARATAEEDGGQARLRLVEGGVALQRPDEAGSEEARGNVPFLPGDRLWSDAGGRAEVQFADGSVLRLDRRSKLDYLEADARRSPTVVTLSLWSGSLYLHVPPDRRRSDYLVETPDGRVDVSEGGSYRIDVDERETRVAVLEGEALLEGERTVRVESGEIASLRRGEPGGRARTFDEREVDDDFARWDAEQGDPLAWQADSQRYLPEELAVYGGDLDRYGGWYYEAEAGYVWRPHVAAGWSPYRDGGWTWTAYGWTWVPSEPWGWAPFHYGRWGWSTAGWYWIPGRRWGPAWVSWRMTSGHVGWCALGRSDRAVWDHADHGRAVPRGQLGGRPDQAWTFVPRGDLQGRDVARHRVALGADEVDSALVLEHARQRLGRDLRVTEASAVPRSVRVRPTPGDSVPELRTDQFGTIPRSGARRRPVDEPLYGASDEAGARARAGRSAEPEAADTRRPRVESQRLRAPERRDEAAPAGREADQDGARARRPAVEREWLRLPADAASRRAPEARSDEPASRRSPPAERDVLRRFFGSFGGSRDEGREARPRDEARPRGDQDRGNGSRGGSSWRAPERSSPRQEPPRQQAPRQESPRTGAARREPPRQDKAEPRPPRER